MNVLHDDRPRGWFHLDNAVIDDYLPRIGATAFAAYACIVRHADRDGRAFPSYTTLQRELGAGRSQVARAIRAIIGAGLVTVESGERSRNVYHIVAVTGLESELVPERDQSRIETGTSLNSRPELVSIRDSNNTHRTIPKKQDPIPSLRSGARATAAYSEEFEAFWSAYGRKGTKATAANEWKKHAKGIPLADILAAIPVYFATQRVAVRGFKLDAERFISRHVWENPTMGEENDAPPRASPNRPVTFEEQKQINNARAEAEFDAMLNGSGPHGAGAFQGADEPPRRRLPG